MQLKKKKALSFIIALTTTLHAVADAFPADADVEEYRICGADGVEGSVQYLIDGKQDMTVYCNGNAGNLCYGIGRKR